MPAQTTIQVRRDSAANWSSTNPVLANGEMGYDTTNKLFKVGDGSTAWNSLKVMAQQGTGSAARPLLTDGAYLDGSTGLVLSGLASNYASAPDSAALSITGDIDIKAKIAAGDWTPAAAQIFVAKWNSGTNQRSYAFGIETNGTLRLYTSADGSTQVTSISSVATGFTDGTTKWIRATLDVNDGAGNRICKFYTSDDGATWTQLGTNVTTAATTTIFDGTAVLEFGGTTLGTGNLFAGTVARVIIQSAYDTADNTTSLQFDANFATQTADALAFTESSSNAATVTVNTLRYTYGVPGVQYSTVTTQTLSANRDYFEPFVVNASTIVDMIGFENTAVPAGNTSVYLGLYTADSNFNPSGAPLVAVTSPTITNVAGDTGLRLIQFSPATLQPGSYVLVLNTSLGLTVRLLRGGVCPVAGGGTNPLQTSIFRSRTAATMPSSLSSWNDYGNGNTGFDRRMILRWKAA